MKKKYIWTIIASLVLAAAVWAGSVEIGEARGDLQVQSQTEICKWAKADAKSKCSNGAARISSCDCSKGSGLNANQMTCTAEATCND